MEQDRILHLRLTGQVQGVGFRAFIQSEAARQHVRGWVRNRRDGSVEALIAGAPEAIGEMLIACRRGPPGAHVEDIEPRAPTPDQTAELAREASFSVRPTA